MKGKVAVLSTTLLLAVVATGFAQENDRPSKVEEVLYHSSQAVLVGGLTWDMVTTVIPMNHPTLVSYQYCENGTSICQFPVSVETSVTFREVGWASWYGIQKPHSVVIANIALDAGILTASHLLYKKGGIWRKVAIGINFAQGGSRLYAGFGNVSKMRSAKLGLVPAGAFSVRW